jgi:hypothetical protein
VGKSSTSSVIPIEGLLTPKSSYLADQGVTLGIEETLASTRSEITPSPTLKTEIVASPPTPTAEGHWPSPQDPALLPECPEPKPIAKSAAVARIASEIGPTLTLLATGSVDPHTQTTSEPFNRVGEDLPDLLQPSDHHKLQEGRPPDRTPLPHGDRPSSSSNTMPAGTPRLDLDSTNKIEPGRPSTRAQSGDSLEVIKEAQHHGFRPSQDLRYRDACPRASSSCNTDQAADATPMPPSRQLWHPTRQGHTLCLA